MLRRALLVVFPGSSFTELLRVARMLKGSGNWSPVVFFCFEYRAMGRDVAACHAEGIVCLDATGKDVSPSRLRKEGDPPGPIIDAQPSVKHRLKQLLSHLPDPLQGFLRRLRGRVGGGLLGVAHHLRYYQRRLVGARQLVKQQKPDILVVAEDNVGYGARTAVLIKAAHEQSAPSVIVPFTFANALQPAEAYLHKPTHSLRRWGNRLVGALYPHWVYEHKGRRLLRLPASEALVQEWLGLAPPLPWILNSGYADAIAVESEFMLQYYRREGLLANRLIVTGALYDDVLSESLKHAPAQRAALYSELGLPAGRPMLLCAVPPNQRSRIGSPECDFGTYEDLVQFWVQSLAEVEGYNVVIRLHPRVKYEDMKYVEKWGVRVSQRDTATLIPMCHIFVASVSSTIRWAIACAKPVVNYDVYRYGYSNFVEAEGVVTMREKESFVATMQRLARDPAFYAEVAAHQGASAQRWGCLDGQAATRMLALFDQLVDSAESESL